MLGLGLGLAKSALSSEGLSLDLQFAADKTLTARRGPTPTFSRASAATEIGPDGLIRYAPENLILQSQNFDNAAWSKFSGSVFAGKVDGPLPASLADRFTITVGSTLARIEQSISVQGTVTFSVWMRADAPKLITVTGLGSNAPLNLTTSWNRFTFTRTSVNITNTPVTLFIGNDLTPFEVWGAQLERHTSARTYIPTTTAQVFGARFDHNPVTLASRGLLIEESRTNSFTRSDDFNNADWVKQGTTISSNVATSPDGATTADRLVEDTSNGLHLTYQERTITAGSTQTLTVFAKADTRSVIRLQIFNSVNSSGVTCGFDLATGEIQSGDAASNFVNGSGATASIQAIGSGWFRCRLTGIVDGISTACRGFARLKGTGSQFSYEGDGTSGVLIWGAQLEAGSFPTSYIPTTTTALTRSADVCSITGSAFSGFYNQSEGTMLTNAFTPASGDRTVLAADDNTANEMIRLRTEGTNPFFKVTDGGSEVVAIDAGTVTANTAFKLIGAYKVNDFASSINGGSAVTDTTGTIPTVDRMRIGAGQGGNTMCGCISAIRYFKKRLPDAKLQSLTT